VPKDKPAWSKGQRHAHHCCLPSDQDAKHWLSSSKREELFGPLGVTNIRTFVDPQDPTRAAVMMDVPDMDAVMSAMETEKAAEAMDFDGVLPETLVIMIEERP
jgi:hypothetical protein